MVAPLRVELLAERVLVAVGRRVVVLGGTTVVVVVEGVTTTGAAGAGLIAATGAEVGPVELLRL